MSVAFVSGEYLDKRPDDIANLIGIPSDFSKYIIFGSDQTMEDLAVAADFFRSKSEARKNGWGGPIETGYSEGVFGRGRIRWYIVNTFPYWDDDQHWKLLAKQGE